MLRSITSIMTLILVGVLLIPIVMLGLQLTGHPTRPVVDRVINQLPLRWTSAAGLRCAEPVVVGTWPPVKGERFPDLVLTDQTGQTTRLADFAGKIILVEYAAIPCDGCQAFAGGNQRGGYRGTVQKGLDSIESYARRYAGVTLGSEDVVFVQVLLYGNSLGSPTAAEVAGWAKHFGMNRDANQIVLRGDASMLSDRTYAMIPGFHLIDRDFVLRSDSCGHRPVDNLYEDLLPMLGRLAASDGPTLRP